MRDLLEKWEKLRRSCKPTTKFLTLKKYESSVWKTTENDFLDKRKIQMGKPDILFFADH